MIKPISIRSDYLSSVYNVNAFQDTVKATIKTAKKMMEKCQFDTIVFTGNSGSALAYILSAEMHIPLICLRREGEQSHFVRDREDDDFLLEGSLDCKRYIIVDDFIVSGATIRRIAKAMHDGMETAKCVGILLYSDARENYKFAYAAGNKTFNVKVFTLSDYFLRKKSNK